MAKATTKKPHRRKSLRSAAVVIVASALALTTIRTEVLSFWTPAKPLECLVQIQSKEEVTIQDLLSAIKKAGATGVVIHGHSLQFTSESYALSKQHPDYPAIVMMEVDEDDLTTVNDIKAHLGMNAGKPIRGSIGEFYSI